MRGRLGGAEGGGGRLEGANLDGEKEATCFHCASRSAQRSIRSILAGPCSGRGGGQQAP